MEVVAGASDSPPPFRGAQREAEVEPMTRGKF